MIITLDQADFLYSTCQKRLKVIVGEMKDEAETYGEVDIDDWEDREEYADVVKLIDEVIKNENS
jgi:hypothetical protein